MNSAPEKGSERLHNLPEARLLPWGRAWFMNICSQPCLPSALKREGADDQVHCVTAGVLGPLGTRMIWDWLPGAFSDWQLGVRLKFLLDFAAWLWRQGLALWGLHQPSYKGNYLQPPVLPHAPPNSPTLKLNERLEA